MSSTANPAFFQFFTELTELVEKWKPIINSLQRPTPSPPISDDTNQPIAEMNPLKSSDSRMAEVWPASTENQPIIKRKPSPTGGESSLRRKRKRTSEESTEIDPSNNSSINNSNNNKKWQRVVFCSDSDSEWAEIDSIEQQLKSGQFTCRFSDIDWNKEPFVSMLNPHVVLSSQSELIRSHAGRRLVGLDDQVASSSESSTDDDVDKYFQTQKVKKKKKRKQLSSTTTINTINNSANSSDDDLPDGDVDVDHNNDDNNDDRRSESNVDVLRLKREQSMDDSSMWLAGSDGDSDVDEDPSATAAAETTTTTTTITATTGKVGEKSLDAGLIKTEAVSSPTGSLLKHNLIHVDGLTSSSSSDDDADADADDKIDDGNVDEVDDRNVDEVDDRNVGGNVDGNNDHEDVDVDIDGKGKKRRRIQGKLPKPTSRQSFSIDFPEVDVKPVFISSQTRSPMRYGVDFESNMDGVFIDLYSESTSEDEEEEASGENVGGVVQESSAGSRSRGGKKLRDIPKPEKATILLHKRFREHLDRVKQRDKRNEQLTKGGHYKDRFILDFDDSNKPLVEVDMGLVEKLKPHQRNAVKMMYDNVIESAGRVAAEDDMPGCVLAHCMGLGKTLSVIAFVHTLLIHCDVLPVRRVLILVPKSVLFNWDHEFKNWMKLTKNTTTIEVFLFLPNQLWTQRVETVKNWFNSRTGVIIMSYDQFKHTLFQQYDDEYTKQVEEYFSKAFYNPGPDLVVFDEGHRLKNPESALFRCVSQIRTRRRVLLSGTPFQNNLTEYYTFVSLVRPGILGTEGEFDGRFRHPIENGQHANSSAPAVRRMKWRTHVLYDTLKPFVDRLDFETLARDLPPKVEHTLFVKLTPLQEVLYQQYLQLVSETKREFFRDLRTLQNICNSPLTLLLPPDEREKKRLPLVEEPIPRDWFKLQILSAGLPETLGIPKPNATSKEKLVSWNSKASNYEIFRQFAPITVTSGKLVLLTQLLEKFLATGDKVLVFSSRMNVLDLIESIFHVQPQLRNYQYGRLDGSADEHRRHELVSDFNKKSDINVLLLGTFSCGQGLNMVAANRVILFDISLNPAWDVQAMFRTYRYGQTKSVFVYRLVCFGTNEHYVYQVQMNKRSMGKRILDEQQIDRHFTGQTLYELKKFSESEFSQQTAEERLRSAKDPALTEVLQQAERNWAGSPAAPVVRCQLDDILLAHRFDEELDDKEKMDAWNDYSTEKQQVATVGVNSSQQTVTSALFESTTNSQGSLANGLRYNVFLELRSKSLELLKEVANCYGETAKFLPQINSFEHLLLEFIHSCPWLRHLSASAVRNSVIKHSKTLCLWVLAGGPRSFDCIDKRLSEQTEEVRRFYALVVPNSFQEFYDRASPECKRALHEWFSRLIGGNRRDVVSAATAAQFGNPSFRTKHVALKFKLLLVEATGIVLFDIGKTLGPSQSFPYGVSAPFATSSSHVLSSNGRSASSLLEPVSTRRPADMNQLPSQSFSLGQTADAGSASTSMESRQSSLQPNSADASDSQHHYRPVSLYDLVRSNGDFQQLSSSVAQSVRSSAYSKTLNSLLKQNHRSFSKPAVPAPSLKRASTSAATEPTSLNEVPSRMPISSWLLDDADEDGIMF